MLDKSRWMESDFVARLVGIGSCLSLAFVPPAWVFGWSYLASDLEGFWSLVAWVIGYGPIVAWVIGASFAASDDLEHDLRGFARIVRCLLIGIVVLRVLQPSDAAALDTSPDEAYFLGATWSAIITLVSTLWVQRSHADDHKQMLELYRKLRERKK